MAERRPLPRRPLVVAALLVAAVAGCSDDGGDGDALAPGTTGEVTTPTEPDPLPPSPAGIGAVSVGGSTSSFEVTSCRLEPDPTAPEGARALITVEGAGTTGSEVPFTVEVQRFATSLNDVVTFTDTIAYSDPARILQAQRIEVAGQVTDLRDPDATSALLRPRDGGVAAVGLASAPGDDADDGGLVPFALDVTC